MKQLGISPYGILQTPARKRSLHPAMFGRLPYSNPVFTTEFVDGLYWGSTSFQYASGTRYYFGAFGTTNIADLDPYLVAFYGYIPFQGFTGGELWNFILKPATEIWFT